MVLNEQEKEQLIAKIMDKYESLFTEIEKCFKGRPEFERQEEALFWEQFGFECVARTLLHFGINFQIEETDIRPVVQDVTGKEVEIDFRMRINNQTVYFGVTHFYGRPKDLGKDMVKVDIPAKDIKYGEPGKMLPVTGTGRIREVRSQKEYLQRRLVVRTAREGLHKFNNDYVLIAFPKLDLGFGSGLDAIPTDFEFDSGSSYYYKEKGFTALILIGHLVEKTKKESGIKETGLIIRTKTFKSSTTSMQDILRRINRLEIDITNVIQSVQQLMRSGGWGKPKPL